MTQEEINKPKPEIAQEFSRTNIFGEREKMRPETEKISKEDELIKEEIRRELELMDQDPNLKKETEDKTKKIQYLNEEEKIKTLLTLAQNKGVAYAIKVAKNMNDPYVLDTFHDALVKGGYYKKFKN